MNLSIWDDLLSDLDKHVIDAAGYASRGASTFSSRRDGHAPALVIIDMQRLFVGPDVPVLEAIEQAPSMIGEIGWRAIEHMLPLVVQCRQQQIPVFYARMLPHNCPADDPMLSIVEPLRSHAGDIIIQKTGSSAFHKTSLAADLRQRGRDSVILIGNSTSGCIRAAAVDATQHGFGVYVPYECVFDRIQASHKISLLDMWMKYATVLSTEAMIQRLGAMPAQADART